MSSFPQHFERLIVIQPIFLKLYCLFYLGAILSFFSVADRESTRKGNSISRSSDLIGMSTLVFLRRSECKALLNKPLLFIKSVKDIKRYINVPYFQLFATPCIEGGKAFLLLLEEKRPFPSSV